MRLFAAFVVIAVAAVARADDRVLIEELARTSQGWQTIRTETSSWPTSNVDLTAALRSACLADVSRVEVSMKSSRLTDHSIVNSAQVACDQFRAADLVLAQQCGTSIRSFYQRLLGRDPDEGGFAGWMNACTSGQAGIPAIYVAFLQSPEYALNGAPAYVRRLYTDLLLRTPSEDEVRWQANALLSGALTRAQLEQNFLNSAEYHLKH